MNARSLAAGVPAGIDPASLAGQAYALRAALVNAPAPPLASLSRAAARSAMANYLRRKILARLQQTASAGVAELSADHPAASESQWKWVLRSLVDAGHIERQQTGGHRHRVRYRITALGRAAAAAETPRHGEH